MAATVSGAVLSSLFFDHSNATGDQEGFLLGQVISHITDTISDTQLNNIKEENKIYINSFLPCKGLFSFYDNIGNILEEKLADILQEKNKDVVGWYRYRRNTTAQISMREKVIHQKLVGLFPGHQATHFCFSLFTTSATPNLATHNFDYTVFQYQNGSFKGIPVHLVNLGDTAQSRYKVYNSGAHKVEATMYGGIINQFESAFIDKKGEVTQVHQIQEMNSTMHRKLKNLCHGITQSEQEVEVLVREVEELKQRVKDREKHIEKTESLIDLKSRLGSEILKPTMAPTYSVPIEMDKTLAGSSTKPKNNTSSTKTIKQETKDPFNFVDDLIKSEKDLFKTRRSNSLPRQIKQELSSTNYDKTKTNSLKHSSNVGNEKNGHARSSDSDCDRSNSPQSDRFSKSPSPTSADYKIMDDYKESMSPVF